MEGDFLYNPNGNAVHCHAASLLCTSWQELFTVWYSYPEHEYQGGRIVIARKRYEAPRWERSIELFSDTPSSAGNPVLFEDPASGELILLFVLLKGPYWTDAVLHWSKSQDRGHTWERPSVLSPQHGLMARHPPCLLSSKRLMLPLYDERHEQSHFMLLSDDGLTTGATITQSHLIQALLLPASTRDLVALFRPSGNSRTISRSISHDEGRSWEEPTSTALPCPYSGISGVVRARSLFVVYNHTTESRRTPLSIARSDDLGLTWRPPLHIDTSPHEVSYPSFIAHADGSVHGVYTYNRRMIKYVRLQPEDLP